MAPGSYSHIGRHLSYDADHDHAPVVLHSDAVDKHTDALSYLPRLSSSTHNARYILISHSIISQAGSCCSSTFDAQGIMASRPHPSHCHVAYAPPSRPPTATDTPYPAAATATSNSRLSVVTYCYHVAGISPPLCGKAPLPVSVSSSRLVTLEFGCCLVFIACCAL
jgi:hypothetical protein